MSRRKQKASTYDDDALVLDIANGSQTYAEIAAKHKLSEVFVGQIARGERRPELQAKIDQVTQGFADRARRLGKRLAQVAMARLGNLAAKDSDAPAETQRKAAGDILAHALGDPSKTDITMLQQNTTPGLSAADLELLAKSRGGPKK